MSRPHRRLPPTSFWCWSLVALLAVMNFAIPPWQAPRGFADAPLRAGPGVVVEILPDHTLLVRQPHLPRPVAVRLLNVEIDPAQNGDAAALVTDVVVNAQATISLDNHRLDRDGNYLAYVTAEGQQLNEALLRAGLARFVYVPGNSESMQRRLKNAEEAAKQGRRGLWQE